MAAINHSVQSVPLFLINHPLKSRVGKSGPVCLKSMALHSISCLSALSRNMNFFGIGLTS